MISIGRHITVLQSVDSTNNYAMAKVRAGLAKHGDAFFALEQFGGKGQRQKSWYSEPGSNLILSVVLNPSGLELGRQFQLLAAIALAVCDFFTLYAGASTRIKWPNDIYWGDRKAGGILIENLIKAGTQSLENKTLLPELQQKLSNPWQWTIAGIGININQTVFPTSLSNPVSLKQITGKEHDPILLANTLCSYLQQRWNQLLEKKDLMEDYNRLLYKINQKVQLRRETESFEAIIKGVTETGKLILITDKEETYAFGELEWLF